jgi:hypothetical protein
VGTLAQALRQRDIGVSQTSTADHAHAAIVSVPSIQGILLSRVMGSGNGEHGAPLTLLRLIRSRNADVPVILRARKGAGQLTAEVMRQTDELVWLLEDTPGFLASRVAAAVLRYREAIAPPFTKALIGFAGKSETRGTRPATRTERRS